MPQPTNLYYSEVLRVLDQGTRPHFVYFIVARTPDPELMFEPLVKIGTSTDVKARLEGLRRGDRTKGADWLGEPCFADLEVLGYVEGDRELESLLHKAFAEHRAGGEWFWYDPVRDTVDDILDEHCCCELCVFIDAFQCLPVEEQRAAWDDLGRSLRGVAQ